MSHWNTVTLCNAQFGKASSNTPTVLTAVGILFPFCKPYCHTMICHSFHAGRLLLGIREANAVPDEKYAAKARMQWVLSALWSCSDVDSDGQEVVYHRLAGCTNTNICIYVYNITHFPGHTVTCQSLNHGLCRSPQCIYICMHLWVFAPRSSY